MISFPRDPGPSADLFHTIDYLRKMATALGAAAVSLMHGQGLIVTQGDRLSAQFSDLQTNLNDVSGRIDDELAQLVAAKGDPAQVEAVITGLTAANDQLKAMSSKLVADDAAPTTPSV